MRKYFLLNAFSPAMVEKRRGLVASVQEITEDVFKTILSSVPSWEKAISHENTAAFLSRKFGVEIPLNRVNVTLRDCDFALIAIPQFRTTEAREYTDDEIQTSPWRFFTAEVYIQE